MTAAPFRSGLVQGVAAYAIWGLLPLFFRLLRDMAPLQVLAHRILWSLAILGVLVLVLRRARAIRAAASARTIALLAASAALIAVNWYVYIWAVAHDRVLAASLGYFINPLVNVALGVVVLRERIAPLQRVAVAIAGAGVLLLAATGGAALWVSLTLAFSFALYGLIRKVVAIDALGGLTIETLLLAAPAAIVVLAAPAGTAAAAPTALLAAAGALTAAPLLLFAGAARSMPYSTLGILQYLAPTLAFLQAVFLFGEPLRNLHLVTFACIWTACALYVFDAVRSARADARRIPPTAA